MKPEPALLLPGADRLPALMTERLQLRWLTGNDTPALFSIFGDVEVCRYWTQPALPDHPSAVALHDGIVRSFEDRTLFQWGIAERVSNAIVGTITLASLSRQHRRAEVGFALARPAWGKGFLSEALPVLIDFAFVSLQLHRLEADVDPRNHRSIRLLERQGFRREGLLRERYHMNGEIQDALLYGLLASEWRLPDPAASASFTSSAGRL